jgi:hypothetical protein
MNTRMTATTAGAPAEDELGVLTLFSNEALASVVRGEVDLRALAARTLADRGYDDRGGWVGFEAAAALMSGLGFNTNRGG